jgi:hypothetical protein
MMAIERDDELLTAVGDGSNMTAGEYVTEVRAAAA